MSLPPWLTLLSCAAPPAAALPPGEPSSGRLGPSPSQAGSGFGASVASAGDVDGDGYEDVVAGAWRYDEVRTDEGAVFLYRGGPAGLEATPSWSATSSQAGSSFGYAVGSAGDVNADGYGDLVVGAYRYDDGQADEGVVFVYLGSAAGLPPTPSWSVGSDQAGAHLGYAVAGAGDTNGDGYDDVIVGAPEWDAGQVDEGRASVYLGGPAGPQAVAAWTTDSDQAWAHLGAAVASAGDTNADGRDDVVVGAYGHDGGVTDQGQAVVHLGTVNGPAPTPAWTATGGQAGAGFGWAVGSAGDADGDGDDEVVVGALWWSGGEAREGGAFVYDGGPTGPQAVSSWTGQGGQADARFGAAVGAAGDVDDDGFDDLVVGAPAYDDGQVDEGAIAVYLGSATGLAAAPETVTASAQAGSSFGTSVASVDANGDGAGDLLVGASGWDEALVDEGAVFVYPGVPRTDVDGDGVDDAVDLCPTAADPAQLDDDLDGLGNACDTPTLEVVGVVSPGAVVSLIGTGAGPGERVHFAAAVGAGFLGPCPPQLGLVCLDLGPAATDLGDAVADAAGVATRPLTVPAIVQPNGTYVVQVAIARGAGGLDSVKSPLVRVDGARLDWDADGLVDELEGSMGTDPADADTDGDGLVDGQEAPLHDPLDPDTDGDGILDGTDACPVPDTGSDADGDALPDRCDLCPADPDPAQSDADGDGLGNACEGSVLLGGPRREINQAHAQFGYSVSSAGDVDGDGFDDVLVGAPEYSSGGGYQVSYDGAAYVYGGTAVGLTAAHVWMESAWVWGARLGTSVAGAGDLNGDGFVDAVIGDGDSSGGSAWVAWGGAGGLGSVQVFAQVSQAWAYFGSEVAGAGDVNGDGFDDVLVGARGWDDAYTDQGSVHLYLGSVAGPALSWEGAYGGPSAGYGTDVDSAGDVDGDGYDDFVVGSRASMAFVYLGAATGPSAVPDETLSFGAAGRAVGSAGDIDGDGYDDVAVGDRGMAYVYFGRTAGLTDRPDWELSVPGVEEVAGAGDVNGDGSDDLLVGAPLAANGQANEGLAFLYLGSPLAVPTGWAWIGEGNQIDAYFGTSVAGAGDIDGDGLADVVVGAHGKDSGQSDEGQIFLYTGTVP